MSTKWKSWQLAVLTIAGLTLGGLTLGSSSVASAEDGGVPLHGFADANLVSMGSSAPDDQRLQGANFGSLDFFLTPEFAGKKIKSLFEVIFETDPNTGAIGVDVERGQLGYVLNDTNTVWIGRFHTPYGIWNTSYHHGKELMPTINRPRFIDFEDQGGILPAHSVGVWLHGSTPIGGNQFKYDVFMANGSRVVPAGSQVGGMYDFNLLKTDHPNAQTGFNLGYLFKQGRMEGLQVGVHAYQTTVNSYLGTADGNATGSNVYSNTLAQSQPNAQSAQLMTGGYLFYETDSVSVDAELYVIQNTNRAPGLTDSHQSNLSFVEADYALHGPWRPYLMFEKTNLDITDTLWQQLIDSASYTRTSVGVRYELSAEACIKMGWAGTNQAATPGMANYNALNTTTLNGSGSTYYDKWAVQYAVRF